ncbi:MAG: HIT domain-containing protein [Acidobacteria bacterium]|jgi:ATP adenylyltransferase|nr:HIT domain-containing protein [Acidobacteriota bacterium]
MRPVFTPWRFDYVSSADKRVDGECIFCRAHASQNDAETLTLWRWENSFALLNRYPYTSGHTMIAPARHESELDALDDATLSEMMVAARTVIRILRSVYHPHGFNVGFNVGEAAGAGIEEHLHLHVVPRWRADTNFISVLGDVRVIPEDLGRTFERLSEALRDDLQGGGVG